MIDIEIIVDNSGQIDDSTGQPGEIPYIVIRLHFFFNLKNFKNNFFQFKKSEILNRW